MKEKKTRKKKQQKEKKEEELEFDFGIGGFSLGGLLRGVEKLIDFSAKLEESGGEIRNEGEIDLGRLKKGMKGVYGFSVKTAIGGKPVVEPFGNIRKTPQGPRIEEEREPMVDVFDEGEEIVIMAEMPGVAQGDINLDLKEDILDISAQRGDRKYRKEVLLPARVEAGTMRYSYNNGILEIKVKKMNEAE